MNNGSPDSHAKITTCIVAAILVILASVLIILPKESWSENENRQLASFPDYSFEALADGDFTSDTEIYLTDHFPLRDLFVSLNTKFCTMLGRSDINDVYICDDGYLIDRFKTPERTETILSAFNRLVNETENRKVALMLVPTAEAIYHDKLPSFAPDSEQLAVMRQYYDGFFGDTIDVSPALLEHANDHQLYYRTDHHWTTYGAYYAYTVLCEHMDLNALRLSDFDIRLISDDFRGTTYSKVNDFSVPGEDMHAFIIPEQRITVEYGTGDNKESGTLYNEDYLIVKDKYSFFLDNIHEQITICNPDAETDRHLVIIKDSYANCFVPFLTAHFSQITVIDPRYYRDSVIDLINSDTSVTDVLILYNLGTLDTDTGATVVF